MEHPKHNDVKISFLDSINEELEQRMSDGFQAYEASCGIDVNYKLGEQLTLRQTIGMSMVILSIAAYAKR